jgi:hypothetical protein
LSEKPLHADLKKWYAQADDRCEALVDGFVIDIVRGDLLIEIQTRNFSALRQKLRELVPHHRVRLVYPVARQKWLVKQAKEAGGKPERRKSPKRGRVEDLFGELVSFPELLLEPNLSLEVLMIREEELRRYDERRAWRRRGWVTVERRLLEVEHRFLFEGPGDLAELMPSEIPEQFTTADLSAALGMPRRDAQRMAYCLRKMGAITEVGKMGRALLYVRAAAS